MLNYAKSGENSGKQIRTMQTNLPLLFYFISSALEMP